MKTSKLNFTTTSDSLEPFSCNSIAQVLTKFNYLERWGDLKVVRELLPSDSSNVKEFFRSAKKMSDSGFQEKKFRELWIRCNLDDISDYAVNGSGDVAEIDSIV